MTSVRFPARIIVGVAALSLAACGGMTATSPAASSGTALIHTASMKIGDKTETVLKNTKGLTLYYFTPDTPTTIAVKACAGDWCLSWPISSARSKAMTVNSRLHCGGAA